MVCGHLIYKNNFLILFFSYFPYPTSVSFQALTYLNLSRFVYHIRFFNGLMMALNVQKQFLDPLPFFYSLPFFRLLSGFNIIETFEVYLPHTILKWLDKQRGGGGWGGVG